MFRKNKMNTLIFDYMVKIIIPINNKHIVIISSIYGYSFRVPPIKLNIFCQKLDLHKDSGFYCYFFYFVFLIIKKKVLGIINKIQFV